MDIHWHEEPAAGKVEGKAKKMTRPPRGTILTVKCINNDGYPCSLTVGKLYKARVGQTGSIGVWDNENDGCYGFEWNMFEIIKEGWDGDNAAEKG